MKIEQSYPCVPREYGIDFRKVPQGSSGKRNIKTESGRLIQTYFFNDLIVIEDREHEDYFMSVFVNEGELIVSLQTWVSDDRHPDFFAGEFLRFALNHFGSQNVEVNQFRAQWHVGSVNYEEYMKNRQRAHLSPVESARRTWSGRIINQLGFTQVHKPKRLKTPDGEPKIEVIFSKQTDH